MLTHILISLDDLLNRWKINAVKRKKRKAKEKNETP